MSVLKRCDLREVTGPVEPQLPRPDLIGDGPVDAVSAIIERVRTQGDVALRALTTDLDGVEEPRLVVETQQLAAARDRISGDMADALERSAEAIAEFHRHQTVPPVNHERDGISVTAWCQPLDRAGIYVPGGLAAYPSTVLMTVVVARVAGVPEVVMCVPPGRDGRIPDATLAAAAIAGVDEVYAVGGAQAVAAMAFGTESIRPVDVIVGPGNAYVAIAKRQVAGHVAVPAAFAGPSETVVVADASTPPRLAAIDLMLQAEHGPGGLSWLVTTEDEVIGSVDREIETLMEAAPRRAEITSTLSGGGYAALVRDTAQAIDVVNAIAPEHLEVLTDDPDVVIGGVRHAGVIFRGVNTPASVGDYVAGPSHVLPTAGTARFSGALSVSDFCKPMHVVELDPSALPRIGARVITLAEAEGLDAHAESIRLRMAT